MTGTRTRTDMVDHANLMTNINCLGIWQVGEKRCSAASGTELGLTKEAGEAALGSGLTVGGWGYQTRGPGGGDGLLPTELTGHDHSERGGGCNQRCGPVHPCRADVTGIYQDQRTCAGQRDDGA